MKNEIIEIVANEFKNAVEVRYKIIEIKLFGSSARGEYSDCSDIDIMIKLPGITRKIEEELFSLAYELELKYDCIIDVIALDANNNLNIPIYSNIENEGVSI